MSRIVRRRIKCERQRDRERERERGEREMKIRGNGTQEIKMKEICKMCVKQVVVVLWLVVLNGKNLSS